MDVVVQHMLEGQRYAANVPANIAAVLEQELAMGRAAILNFLISKRGSNVTERAP
jgi:hypothetical protein